MIRIVEFPAADKLLSANDRENWWRRAERTRTWRTAAFVAGRKGQPVMLDGKATVSVVLPVSGNRRRDPHNYYPTIKAIIDGLTDAGWWPDDDSDHVHTLEPVLDSTATVVRVTATTPAADPVATDMDAISSFRATLRRIDVAAKWLDTDGLIALTDRLAAAIEVPS